MNKKQFWQNKENNEKVILDLCGGTGLWSKPYKDAGYTVYVITLPEVDVNKTQYDRKKKVLNFCGIDYKIKYSISVIKVYGILAAPTCTQFSLARTTAKTPRNLRAGYILVESCLRIIRECRFDGNLKFWVLENPTGYLRQILGKPPLQINPNEYAGYADESQIEAYTKKTDVWGYFNFPKQKPVELTEQQIKDCSINNRQLPQIPEDYVCDLNMTKQAIRRSITPSGFARACFNANK